MTVGKDYRKPFALGNDSSLTRIGMKSLYKKIFLFFLFIPFILKAGMAENILNKMSLDKKIGQLFMSSACLKYPENHLTDIKELLEKYHIGGVIIKTSYPNTQINFFKNQIPKTFESIKNAYLSKELDMEKQDYHVLKILKIKEKLDLFENRFVETFDENILNSSFAYKLKKILENQIAKNEK